MPTINYQEARPASGQPIPTNCTHRDASQLRLASLRAQHTGLFFLHARWNWWEAYLPVSVIVTTFLQAFLEDMNLFLGTSLGHHENELTRPTLLLHFLVYAFVFFCAAAMSCTFWCGCRVVAGPALPG